MNNPVEVETKHNEQGHIVYAICHCSDVSKYDVRFYGAAFPEDGCAPGDGVVMGSPEFTTLEGARDWAAKGGE